MAAKKGRLVVLVTMVLAMGVLVAAAFAFFPYFREQYLIRKLSSNDEDVFNFAVQELLDHGSERSIPYLLVLLKNGGEDLFIEQLERCVERIGKRSVPPLTKFLEEPKDDLIIPVARLLLKADPGNPAVRSALLRTMEIQYEDRVYSSALQMLEKLGEDRKAVFRHVMEKGCETARIWASNQLVQLEKKVLIDALKDPSPVVRVRVACLLADQGHDLEIILPVLIDGIRSGIESAFVPAALELSDIGPAARSAEPALREALKSPSATISVSAAQALFEMDAEEPGLLPVLTEAIEMRIWYAVSLIEDFKDETAPAMAEMLDHLKSKAPPKILFRIAWKAKALPYFREVLQGGNPELAARAAIILGHLGADSEEVVQSLLKVLKEPELWPQYLTIASIGALGNLGPSARAAAPLLGEILDRGEVDLVLESALALGRMGPAAAGEIPRLEKALKCEDASVRIASACALIAMDPARKPELFPGILKTLESGASDLQEAAVKALAILGPRAREAAPALVELALKSDSSEAALALGKIGIDSLSPFLNALRDPDINLRIRSAKMLGTIAKNFKSPLLKEAIPAILELKNEKRLSARQAARRALRAILSEVKSPPYPLESDGFW